MHGERRLFDALDTRIVLVGMGTPRQAESFRKAHGLTFTIICDPHKHLYKTYGLLKAGITDIVSPKTFISGLRALGKGHLPGVPVGDVMQLSGVFLIGKDSVIRYAHYSMDIADYPAVADIIQKGYER
ncbi:redoxin domain-containing protein [Candidatus Magnetobacterium casensis]|uniref:Redoxin domain-containing protein n=1 Tax=Candidatus Magnetobacterium casense TaxID=1455061 RepID=A0ABS6RYD4_9BACT|nr:redoxin domain-containing protein [Candidatus Magnetobacterium casensis]